MALRFQIPSLGFRIPILPDPPKWIPDSTLWIPDSKTSNLLDSGFLHIGRRLAVNWELMQGQRRRQGERRLKILFRVIVITSLQPQVVRNGKRVSNLQE